MTAGGGRLQAGALALLLLLLGAAATPALAQDGAAPAPAEPQADEQPTAPAPQPASAPEAPSGAPSPPAVMMLIRKINNVGQIGIWPSVQIGI